MIHVCGLINILSKQSPNRQGWEADSEKRVEGAQAWKHSGIREESNLGSRGLSLFRNKANAVGKGQAKRPLFALTLTASTYHKHLIAKDQNTSAGYSSIETFV